VAVFDILLCQPLSELLEAVARALLGAERLSAFAELVEEVAGVEAFAVVAPGAERAS
jgi:hypothetical protein